MATLLKETILEDVERIERYLADKRTATISVMHGINSKGTFQLSYNLITKDYVVNYNTKTGKEGYITGLKTTLEAVEKYYEVQNY